MHWTVEKVSWRQRGLLLLNLAPVLVVLVALIASSDGHPAEFYLDSVAVLSILLAPLFFWHRRVFLIVSMLLGSAMTVVLVYTLYLIFLTPAGIGVFFAGLDRPGNGVALVSIMTFTFTALTICALVFGTARS